MKPLILQSKSRRKSFHAVIAALLTWSFPVVVAQEAPPDQPQETTTTEEAPKLPGDQLDSLVAPIALYSDSLLAQTLAASTYPLEITQLQQWMDKNKNLKGQALADAASKQPWDPSIQGLVAFPDVVQRMAGNIQWTTDLGNAFLAQQSEVMDAVQRMRAKAQGTGNLKTSAQQVVKTETVGGGTSGGGKQVIEIQQANPDVAYVPSYDPTVVYGAAPADYPYANYSYPGYVPGSALAWGAGVAVGAAAWGAWGGNWGNWGNCDWNHGDVNINNNNNFNRNYNKNVSKNVNRGQAGQGNQWQHNAKHRGNAPYGSRQTANKYGGTTRGQGGTRTSAGAGTRPGGATAGAGNRPGGAATGAGNRPGGAAGGVGNRPGGGAGANAKAAGGGAGARPGGGGAGAKPGGGTAKNQVGNRSASSRPSAGSKGGGFSGGSGNYARASSSRGGKSMGGGGASRGGGGGGGHRGGGGGGRGGGGGGRR